MLMFAVVVETLHFVSLLLVRLFRQIKKNLASNYGFYPAIRGAFCSFNAERAIRLNIALVKNLLIVIYP